jgi:hypothetical protein
MVKPAPRRVRPPERGLAGVLRDGSGPERTCTPKGDTAMTAYWLRLGDAAPPHAWPILEALAARAADDPALPPVVPDDFLYAARVQRAGLPDLHILRHVLTAGYLGVDDLGGLWRFVGRGAGADGYAQVASLAEALTRAGIDRAERVALRTRQGPRRPDLTAGSDPHDIGDDDTDVAFLHALDDHTAEGELASA